MTDNNDDIKELGTIDYAILKLLTIGMWTIADVINLLQIRSLVIEKHIYSLTREGFIDFQLQHFIITPKGQEITLSFERNNPIDKWKPVDDFIMNSIENRKTRKIKFYKMIDFILLILIVILIILIIYYGKDIDVNNLLK